MPMTMTDPQWQAAADAIEAASTILAVAHTAPDGDAIGSLLGLAESPALDGEKTSSPQWMGARRLISRLSRAVKTIAAAVSSGEFDLMIAVDSSDVERIGQAGAYGMAHSRNIINLDHHPTNTRFGDIHLIVPRAVAAAEVVFDFLHHLNCEISEDAAYALLTGLITDTRGFRISATSSRTLEIAQALMQKKAPLSRIMAHTLQPPRL